jgi:putative methionine-R-sulfoxide reductase with GAF domain
MSPAPSNHFEKRTFHDTADIPSPGPLRRPLDDIPPLGADLSGTPSGGGASHPLGLLGRVQLQQELSDVKSRAEKLQVLHEIGAAITASLGLEEILTRIVDAAVYVTQAEEGSLLMLDETTQELQLRAQKGLGESHAHGLRIQTADSIAGTVVETNQPQRLESKEQELKVVTGYLVKSILYVPVAVKDRVIGVLVVDNQTPDKPFSDDDEKLLQVLAGYAAIALENARLRQELDVQSSTGAVAYPAEATLLQLQPDPEPPPVQALSPGYVSDVIIPYVRAMVELQHTLDELDGQPRREVRILTIQPGTPVSLAVAGLDRATHLLEARVQPWKEERASLLAEATQKEGETTIETAWVEILEARARAAAGPDEREKALAQAGHQRAEVARRLAEAQPLRSDMQRAILQLAFDLLAELAPNLPNGEQIVRALRLLPPLETIVTSPLALSSGTRFSSNSNLSLMKD